MTGYGDSEFAIEDVPFAFEIRSVNHRHLDVRVRVPRALARFENALRAQISTRLGRGKVDASLRFVGQATPFEQVEVNLEAAERYLDAARDLEARLHVSGSLDVNTLLTLPGVTRVAEREFADPVLEDTIRRALDDAIEALLGMRATEGVAMERDLRERLARCDALVDQIDERALTVQQKARERLQRRSRELAKEVGAVDDGRLQQEIAYTADRLDISEEMLRLRSHLERFVLVLDAPDPGTGVGRQLDFLLQEMTREINTTGSKVSDASAAHLVVEVKGELERIREQVQNIE